MKQYIRTLSSKSLGRYHFLIGMGLTAIIAGSGLLLSETSLAKSWGFSALTLSIALGILLGNTLYPKMADSCGTGVAIAKQQLLRLGIIFYGLRITFQQIEAVGLNAIVTDFFVLGTTFLLAYWLGTRVLKIDRDTALLIGAGSSICGAAAVMATEPVVKAQSSKVSIAVATVVVFGTAGMFLYPMMYHFGATLLPFFSTEGRYGVYAGSTIHEVAQVFAAGQAIGTQAADTAVIVKMIRVMMLAPFLILLSIWLSRKDALVEGERRKITIPWFAVIFVLMAGVNSLQVLPEQLTHVLVEMDSWLLAMAMAALGLTTHLKAIRQAGFKPLLLGAVLFAYLIVGGGTINFLVTRLF